MQTIVLKKRPINLKDYTLRRALPTDYDIEIHGSCHAVDEDGKTLFIYKELELDDTEMLWALKRIKYEKNRRTSGLVTTSRIFGFNPRNAIRKDFCSSASLSWQQPKEHKIVTDYAYKIAKEYAASIPETYKQHEELTKEKIQDDYAITGTPFTSGIINKNNPLKYHFDSGNFENVYSCMAVFRKNMEGGWLAMPEYNVGVHLRHNSVFMFDGQSILHGVTPMKPSAMDAYRYTIVYYSLRKIWDCLPLTEEMARIRAKKSES